MTEIEIFKYCQKHSFNTSFFETRQIIKNSSALNSVLEPVLGLFLLKNRQAIINIRQKRLKIAQVKWKKLKKLAKYLTLVPFLQLAAATGSLTAYNTHPLSDFDLLIVAQKNRLWLTRILLTGLVGFLGKRRHGQKTKNRICLNCYLTQDHLEIEDKEKPHDFHSAQEYGRLTPILEISKDPYQKFINANLWLTGFLQNYPWSNNQTAKKIKVVCFFKKIRGFFEWLLSNQIGDWLERKTGQWQTKRIQQKKENQPPDQVYVSDQCLMFHPQSKSYKLMKQFGLRMEQLT